MKITMKISPKRSIPILKNQLFGEDSRNILDKIVTFFLALTPILQHYKGPIGNAGITVLVLVLSYFLATLFIRKCEIRLEVLGSMIPLVCFCIYKAFIHERSMMGIAQAGVIALFYIFGATGIIKISGMLRSAMNISIIASILIIVQNVSYYLFGHHIQMVPTSLLLPESSQWILGAKTGRAGINGVMTTLYRPSAFFLEPSHMFLYIFPLLFILLLAPEMNTWKKRRALLLSAGIVLSTSGMGICIVALAWGIYFGLNNGKLNHINLKNIFRWKNLMIILIFAIIGFVALFTIPTLRQSVERILTGDAISGRTSQANDLLRSLSRAQMVFGVTSTTEGIIYNLSGFAATLYKFGVVGIILSYAFYVQSAIQFYPPTNWIGVVILMISFFSAHTHGTIYMLYYVLILTNGASMYGKKGKIRRRRKYYGRS